MSGLLSPNPLDLHRVYANVRDGIKIYVLWKLASQHVALVGLGVLWNILCRTVGTLGIFCFATGRVMGVVCM